MKPLILANSDVWGGAEAFLFSFCKELIKSHIFPVVICPPNGPLFSRFTELTEMHCYREEMGTPALRWRGSGALTMYGRSAATRSTELLERMRQRHGCDVVLLQYPREQALVTSNAKQQGYRVCWLAHSPLYYFLSKPLLLPLLRKQIFHTHCATVISQATRRRYIHAGFPGDRLNVLPVAIDVPSPASICTRPSTPVITVLSRLHHCKGIHDLLLAAPGILARYPNAKFNIVGDGPYRRSLEKMACRLSIAAAVRFWGFHRSPREILANSSVLVHTTFDPGDSMPTVLLEALADGVPVVATRWAGIPEMIDHDAEGLLVEPKQPDQIRDAVLALLDNPERTAQMAGRGQRRVQQEFTMPVVARRLMAAMS